MCPGSPKAGLITWFTDCFLSAGCGSIARCPYIYLLLKHKNLTSATISCFKLFPWSQISLKYVKFSLVNNSEDYQTAGFGFYKRHVKKWRLFLPSSYFSWRYSLFYLVNRNVLMMSFSLKLQRGVSAAVPPSLTCTSPASAFSITAKGVGKCHFLPAGQILKIHYNP